MCNDDRPRDPREFLSRVLYYLHRQPWESKKLHSQAVAFVVAATPGPLTDITLPVAEQKGMAHLFAGASPQ